MLLEGQYSTEDLKKGSIALITDAPVGSVRLLDTIVGGFSYAIVIGDSGWHQQKISYKMTSMLSGTTTKSYLSPETIEFIPTDKSFNFRAKAKLRREVKEKIKPPKVVRRKKTKRKTSMKKKSTKTSKTINVTGFKQQTTEDKNYCATQNKLSEKDQLSLDNFKLPPELDAKPRIDIEMTAAEKQGIFPWEEGYISPFSKDGEIKKDATKNPSNSSDDPF